MIYRIPITKDTTLSTWSDVPALRNFGNAGASQIVDVWAQYRNDKDQKFLTRFLAEANLTALQNAIASGRVPDPVTDSSVTCTLKFFNINHGNSVAYDYTLQVFPLSASWQEGRGTRIDSFTNTGFANWLSASTTAAWVAAGGDYVIDSSSATQYFDSGSENLSINIRPMLVNWLSGASSNYGFLVKMDPVAETLTGPTTTNTQYYRKSFHGKLTNYTNFAPYIQLDWSSVIKDDRKLGQFGQDMNLYFYNAPGGNYSDIDGISAYFPGKITLSGARLGTSGAVSGFTGISSDNAPVSANNLILANLTGSRIRRGIYRIRFTLPASASIYNNFIDTWAITSAASAITRYSYLKFYPISSVSGDNNVVEHDTNMAIPNWKPYYSKESIISKKVYFFEDSANVLPLAQSEKNSISSIASSTLNTYISTSGWWRVITDPLGTIDIDWQVLEYDGESNFFTIDFSNFMRGIIYKLEFKINIRGEVVIFDDKNGARPYHFEVLE